MLTMTWYVSMMLIDVSGAEAVSLCRCAYAAAVKVCVGENTWSNDRFSLLFGGGEKSKVKKLTLLV